jgi:hypothetical protein
MVVVSRVFNSHCQHTSAIALREPGDVVRKTVQRTIAKYFTSSIALRLKTTNLRSSPVSSSQTDATVVVGGIDQVVMDGMTFDGKSNLFLDSGPQLLLVLL